MAPSPTTPAAPSALTPPVPPAADGDTIVQVRYQPQVRELLNLPGGPQLELLDADGALHFSAPPGAAAGQVLIVAGRAYWVRAVDATGRVLSTRAPELGEVFASLRVKSLVQEATLAAPAAAGGERRQALAAGASPSAITATSTVDFKTDIASVGPVGISYKGQLGMTMSLDIDYNADTGFKTLSLVGNGLLSHTLTYTLNRAGSAAGAADGIELARPVYVIPQTLGLVKIELPLYLQVQASGEAKLAGPLLVGNTGLLFDLHWDAGARKLAGEARFDNSATSGSPTVADAPSTALSTQGLALNVKLGPDVQLKLLDTVLPLSASVRLNAGLKAQLASNGQRICTGWVAQLALEGSTKARLGVGLDFQQQLVWPFAALGGGDDLALCQRATEPVPDPMPTPTPVPAPTPTLPVPPLDSLTLLPLPTGATLLNGYQLVLAVDTWTPDRACDDTFVPYPNTGAGDTPQLGPYRVCKHTLEPQIRSADGSRVELSAAAYQDWNARFAYEAGEARCAMEVRAAQGIGLIRPPDLRPLTWRRDEFSTTPLLSRSTLDPRVAPYAPSGVVYSVIPDFVGYSQATMVCQMTLTERLGGQRFYLRSALWTASNGMFLLSTFPPGPRVTEVGY